MTGTGASRQLFFTIPQGAKGDKGDPGDPADITNLTSNDITDATSTGKSLLTATSSTTARTALGLSAGATAGAGTASLLNTGTSSTNYVYSPKVIADYVKAQVSAADANSFKVVNHGTNASTARPAGAMAVYWIGTAQPTNAVKGDMWSDEA